MQSTSNELPLNETTLAQEMKSAGYRTYLLGKWHMGFSTYQHFPTNRGFDYFYGILYAHTFVHLKVINLYYRIFVW